MRYEQVSALLHPFSSNRFHLPLVFRPQKPMACYRDSCGVRSTCSRPDIGTSPRTPIPSDNTGTYTRDYHHVYFEDEVLPGANPKTFQVIKEGYAKDNDSVFSRATRIDWANPETFEVLSWEFTKDDEEVWYRAHSFSGFSIDGVDVATFTALGAGIGKDRNSVYIEYFGEGKMRTLENVDHCPNL